MCQVTRNTDVCRAYMNGALTELEFQTYRRRGPSGQALIDYFNPNHDVRPLVEKLRAWESWPTYFELPPSFDEQRNDSAASQLSTPSIEVPAQEFVSRDSTAVEMATHGPSGTGQTTSNECDTSLRFQTAEFVSRHGTAVTMATHGSSGTGQNTSNDPKVPPPPPRTVASQGQRFRWTARQVQDAAAHFLHNSSDQWLRSGPYQHEPAKCKAGSCHGCRWEKSCLLYTSPSPRD